MPNTIHVHGYRPPDTEWTKKKQAWDACKAAGVDPPKEIEKFFDWEAPSDLGVQVDISDALTKYSEEMIEGFTVDLTKLPKDLRYIRFYNSY